MFSKSNGAFSFILFCALLFGAYRFYESSKSPIGKSEVFSNDLGRVILDSSDRIERTLNSCEVPCINEISLSRKEIDQVIIRLEQILPLTVCLDQKQIINNYIDFLSNEKKVLFNLQTSVENESISQESQSLKLEAQSAVQQLKSSCQ